MKRKTYLILMIIVAVVARAQDYPTKITVDQNGSGDYNSIQEAINATKAFPDAPIEIFIKAGIYYEKVIVYAWNTQLSLIGDTTGQTIIRYDDYFTKINLGRNSTFHTYTLKVEANDFYAKRLTIENTAGDIGQAVAVHIDADRVHFEQCKFFGNQDTMYLSGENKRQYFNDCTISGTTDFIFGPATVFFENCIIISKKASYITAASTPKSAEFGFVFNECTLLGEGVEKESVYLGRPWRGYAQTVFLNCEMGKHIHPQGWKEWHQGGQVFYAEYRSKGKGGVSNNRVEWSLQLSEIEAANYNLKNIFKDWNPLIK